MSSEHRKSDISIVKNDFTMVASIASRYLTPRRKPVIDWPWDPDPFWVSVATPVDWCESGHAVVACFKFGQGPVVLLIHGWEGQASDMAGFVQPLLALGYQVIALDLPSHGRSDGIKASIPLAAQAVLKLGQRLGELHGAVAHSMGGPVLVEAMAAGLSVKRVSFISPPCNYVTRARQFGSMSKLDETQLDELIRQLTHEIDFPMSEVDIPSRAAFLNQPALFVHSDDDKVVPLSEGLESSDAWPGAQQQTVTGLGHRRILDDEDVIRDIVKFVAQGAE